MGAKLHGAHLESGSLVLPINEAKLAGIVAWVQAVHDVTNRTIVFDTETKLLRGLDDGQTAATKSLLAKVGSVWFESGDGTLASYNGNQAARGILLADLIYFRPLARVVVVNSDETIGVADDAEISAAAGDVTAVVSLTPHVSERQFFE